MRYLKWKLSEGTWGTPPVVTIHDMGGSASTSEYADDDGYRIAYLWEDVDITQLDSAWDVTEVTEAEALAFCQVGYPDAVVGDTGGVTGPTPPDPDVIVAAAGG